MTFLSPSFMFIFMPLAMAVYVLVPPYKRVSVLPVISLAFLICVNLNRPYSLLFAAVIFWATVLSVHFYRNTKNARILAVLQGAAGVAAVAVLVLRLTAWGSKFIGTGLLILLAAVISLCSDIRNKEGRTPDSPWDALTYVSFFPVLLVGPILRYGDFVKMADHAKPTMSLSVKGLLRFFLGFAKCLMIGAVLKQGSDLILAEAENQIGLCTVLLLMLVGGVCAYSFFSGYSDMAVGICHLLGFPVGEDFNAPLAAITPFHYVKRSFISFYGFFVQYVARPILTRTKGSTVGRLLTGLVVGACHAFLFAHSLSAALVLWPFLSIMALCFLFGAKHKGEKKTEAGENTAADGMKKRHTEPKIAGRVIGWTGTLLLFSLFWFFVILNTPANFAALLKKAFSADIFALSYKARAVLGNAKYVLIPLLSALFIGGARRAFALKSVGQGLCYDSDEPIVYVIWRIACVVLTTALYVMALVLFLPQFPELTTEAFGFLFV